MKKIYIVIIIFGIIICSQNVFADRYSVQISIMDVDSSSIDIEESAMVHVNNWDDTATLTRFINNMVRNLSFSSSVYYYNLGVLPVKLINVPHNELRDELTNIVQSSFSSTGRFQVVDYTEIKETADNLELTDAAIYNSNGAFRIGRSLRLKKIVLAELSYYVDRETDFQMPDETGSQPDISPGSTSERDFKRIGRATWLNIRIASGLINPMDSFLDTIFERGVYGKLELNFLDFTYFNFFVKYEIDYLKTENESFFGNNLGAGIRGKIDIRLSRSKDIYLTFYCGIGMKLLLSKVNIGQSSLYTGFSLDIFPGIELSFTKNIGIFFEYLPDLLRVDQYHINASQNRFLAGLSVSIP